MTRWLAAFTHQRERTPCKLFWPNPAASVPG